MGSQYGPEQRLARAAGIDFIGLPVRGFLGRGLRAFAAAGRMACAVCRARGIIRRFRPQVVAGFGGYAAFAPMLAARLAGVPTVLHEQNAIAGMSNRILGSLARRICLSLPGTEGFDASRTVLTGNPVRAAVVALAGRQHDFSGKRLLVMGGSLGAHALNVHVCRHLDALRAAGIEVRHQTGVRDEAVTREAYAAAGYDPACVSAFIDDMASAYAWADLVLCRAGATTVAELCAAGLPSVLVPFPYAVHDHQTRNAQALVAEGAALMLPEARMESDGLMAQVTDLLQDTGRLRTMAAAASGCARVRAAELVAAELETVCAR